MYPSGKALDNRTRSGKCIGLRTRVTNYGTWEKKKIARGGGGILIQSWNANGFAADKYA